GHEAVAALLHGDGQGSRGRHGGLVQEGTGEKINSLLHVFRGAGAGEDILNELEGFHDTGRKLVEADAKRRQAITAFHAEFVRPRIMTVGNAAAGNLRIIRVVRVAAYG